MTGLRDLNSKLDYYWNEYSKRFPAFCYIDENGNKSKPLIVPGQTLRRDAPMYMKRLVDEDPTSYYFMMQANPLKGPADRLTAVEFFFDFFQTKLGMRSSFQDQGMDPIQAADAEVLPAPKDDLYKRYYDEQVKAAEAQRAAEKKAVDDQAFKDKFGFDRNDPDIIDIDVDADADAGNGDNAGRDIQARDAKAGAVALPKNIFYAVDMHIPAGMELGYDGRGANRMGGRGNGRLGHGGFGRLGFESEELKEAAIPGDDPTPYERKSSVFGLIQSKYGEILAKLGLRLEDIAKDATYVGIGKRIQFLIVRTCNSADVNNFYKVAYVSFTGPYVKAEFRGEEITGKELARWMDVNGIVPYVFSPVISDDDTPVLTTREIGKRIAEMFDRNEIVLNSSIYVEIKNSTYGVKAVEPTAVRAGYAGVRIVSNNRLGTDVTIRDMLDSLRKAHISKFSEITELIVWMSNRRWDIIGLRFKPNAVVFVADDVIGKRTQAGKRKQYRSMFDSEIDEALVPYDTQVEPGFDKESRTTFKQYDVEYLYERRGIVSDGTESEYVSANSLLDLIRQVSRAIRSEIGPDAKLAEFVRVVDLSTDRDVTDQVNKRITQVIGESEEEGSEDEGSEEETSKLTAGGLQKKIKDFETESEKKDFAVTVKLPDGTEAEDVTAEVEEGKVTIVCPAAEEETPEEEPTEDDAEEETPEEDDAEESDPVNESISQDYADYCRTLIAD